MTSEGQLYHFISNRNVTVGGMNGRRIAFAKGKPTHVPRTMHALIMERGILPCTADGKVLETPEAAVVDPEAPRVLLAPETQEERDDAMKVVFKAIVEKNNAKDFAGGGTPGATAVSAALGWRVDQKEVRALWTKVRSEFLTDLSPGD